MVLSRNQMKQTAKERASLLKQALENRTRTTTKQEIARAAGVSVRTVQEVLNGSYATEPRPSLTEKKQLRGYTEALTRLAVYLSLKPEKVVAEFGIDTNWSDVVTAIERVRFRAVVTRGVPDPVLDAVFTR